MIELQVFLERLGRPYAVGYITGRAPEEAVFSYSEEYMSDPMSVPISLSLPFSENPFSPSRTRCFFDGLLPEGFLRRTVAKWMHTDADDYLSILVGLGQECLGAVRIAGIGDEEPIPSYEPVTDQEAAALAREGATSSAEIVTKTHLSLTGASGKAGLYYDASGDQWYLPHGTAASTHIVKQSHVRLSGIVMNEQMALQTAARVGIEVPESFIINLGNAGEGEVLFATRRYDRKMGDRAPRISGLPSPYRLHQEDFAQVLGISAAKKYEDHTDHYLQKMFALLRQYSTDPVRDQLKLWDKMMFDFLIGNTDAHLKNVSLLYDESLKNIRMAPVYDVVSTVVYSSATRDMAVYYGRERSLDRITRENLREAASEAGLGTRMAMRRLDRLCDLYEKALGDAADSLEAAGFAGARTMREQILENGGFRRLL